MSLFENLNVQIRCSNFTLIEDRFRRELERLILAVSKALFLNRCFGFKKKSEKKKIQTVFVLNRSHGKCNRFQYSESIACANKATTIMVLGLYHQITCIGSNSERLIRRFADFTVQANKTVLETKDIQKMPLGKLSFFCIRYFSKTKSKPAKKNTGQCLLTKTKPTCKN